MAGHREKATAVLLGRIKSLTPNSDNNRKMYAAKFAAMSDKEFEAFVVRLEEKVEHISVISPNNSGDGLSTENNLKIADSMGHSFFQKLWIVGKGDLPDHLTPVSYMVVDLPVRRASQTSDKKISVPKHSKVVDALTGQVTGESKGAALSAPEVQVLAAMGMEAPLIETMKYRGGDTRGRIAYNGMLAKYGEVSIKSLSAFASGVESTATVKTFLNCAHLKNTL